MSVSPLISLLAKLESLSEAMKQFLRPKNMGTLENVIVCVVVVFVVVVVVCVVVSLCVVVVILVGDFEGELSVGLTVVDGESWAGMGSFPGGVFSLSDCRKPDVAVVVSLVSAKCCGSNVDVSVVFV